MEGRVNPPNHIFVFLYQVNGFEKNSVHSVPSSKYTDKLKNLHKKLQIICIRFSINGKIVSYYMVTYEIKLLSQ